MHNIQGKYKSYETGYVAIYSRKPAVIQSSVGMFFEDQDDGGALEARGNFTMLQESV